MKSNKIEENYFFFNSFKTLMEGRVYNIGKVHIFVVFINSTYTVCSV